MTNENKLKGPYTANTIQKNTLLKIQTKVKRTLEINPNKIQNYTLSSKHTVLYTQTQ